MEKKSSTTTTTTTTTYSLTLIDIPLDILYSIFKIFITHSDSEHVYSAYLLSKALSPEFRKKWNEMFRKILGFNYRQIKNKQQIQNVYEQYLSETFSSHQRQIITKWFDQDISMIKKSISLSDDLILLEVYTHGVYFLTENYLFFVKSVPALEMLKLSDGQIVLGSRNGTLRILTPSEIINLLGKDAASMTNQSIEYEVDNDSFPERCEQWGSIEEEDNYCQSLHYTQETVDIYPYQPRSSFSGPSCSHYRSVISLVFNKTKPVETHTFPVPFLVHTSWRSREVDGDDEVRKYPSICGIIQLANGLVVSASWNGKIMIWDMSKINCDPKSICLYRTNVGEVLQGLYLYRPASLSSLMSPDFFSVPKSKRRQRIEDSLGSQDRGTKIEEHYDPGNYFIAFAPCYYTLTIWNGNLILPHLSLFRALEEDNGDEDEEEQEEEVDEDDNDDNSFRWNQSDYDFKCSRCLWCYELSSSAVMSFVFPLKDGRCFIVMESKWTRIVDFNEIGRKKKLEPSWLLGEYPHEGPVYGDFMEQPTRYFDQVTFHELSDGKLLDTQSKKCWEPFFGNFRIINGRVE